MDNTNLNKNRNQIILKWKKFRSPKNNCKCFSCDSRFLFTKTGKLKPSEIRTILIFVYFAFPSVYCVSDWRQCTTNYVTDFFAFIFISTNTKIIVFFSFANITIRVFCCLHALLYLADCRLFYYIHFNSIYL